MMLFSVHLKIVFDQVCRLAFIDHTKKNFQLAFRVGCSYFRFGKYTSLAFKGLRKKKPLLL